MTELTREEKKNYILVPAEFQHSSNPRDFSICGHRLSAGEKGVNETAKELGLEVENTGRDLFGRWFVGSINYEQAMKLVLGTGLTVPNVRQTLDTFLLLRDFLAGKVKQIHDGNGNKIRNRKLAQGVYDGYLRLVNPQRGEWFADRYFQLGKGLYVGTNPFLKDTTLVYDNLRLLESCLMEDKTHGIDLEDWLNNANNQGLPKANARKGSLYYRGPANGAVAWFRADSYRANLICNRVPAISYVGLGVRRLFYSDNQGANQK